MKLMTILFLLAGLGYCSHSRSDNVITVDQVGSNNSTTIQQDGYNHTATITTGKLSDVDYTTLSILQQGSGAKTANIEINSGINNSASIQQDGTGNHTANILNLNGSGNNISVGQSGSGNHTMNIVGAPNTNNSGNTIDATQSGSGNKSFDLTLSGTLGAGVTVQQTNPTQSNSGSMNIQCTAGCGGYSYIRN